MRRGCDRWIRGAGLLTGGLCLAAAVTTAHPRVSPVPEPAWPVKLTPDLREWVATSEPELEVLVRFRPGSEMATSSEIAPGAPERVRWIRETGEDLSREYQPFGVTVVSRFEYLPLVHLRVPTIMLEALAADPRVASLEPIRVLHAMRQNGKAMLEVPAVHALGLDGAGVSVAVLDTGVDYRHPELAPGGTDAAAKTVKLWDAIGNDDDPMDENGHGTSVAGIIAGSVDGVAPKARIVAVRVLNAQGSSQSSSIMVGLDKVIASVVAGNPFNIRAVNLSLGGLHRQYWPPNAGTCDDIVPSYKDAFDTLTNLGVAVFVAAGNDGCSTGVAIPACVSNAVAVGAVHNTYAYRGRAFSDLSCGGSCEDVPANIKQISCYSNSGDKLAVWAPAHNTVTPTLQPASGQPGTMTYAFGGTSAAAPYVAGVAALLAGAHPAAGPRAIRDAITSTGEPITDARNSLVRNLVNAPAALQRLEQPCDAPSAPTSISVHPGTVCKLQKFTIAWAPVAGATSYTLEIANTADFADSSFFDTGETSLTLLNDDPADTVIFLRLRSNVACGSSAWSNLLTMRYEVQCGQPVGHTARRRLGSR
ncbi:MAG TPA: S8 family serine peptidase [Thermoanaerobaculaceae bacterium]|nr:S8 family serine peptidase [Acidobacteriota bacterium]NLH12074.1 S8 family serine peptidase [Holophagae bacterium]HPW56355.1 S8 family serine peptidase [Thermoanaerobaculaceae bacterium]